MSAHTKGRLKLQSGFLRNERGMSVAIEGSYGTTPDMKRLAALWNAAEELGLSTADIEAGVIGRAINALLDKEQQPYEQGKERLT